MNESPKEAWFYTREGERLGPVTFSDLRVKAAESSLNPRLDMVWSQGMDNWKPAGEVDGLFEKRAAPEPQEDLAPAADPYVTPKQQPAAGRMGQEGEWPGMGRLSYFVALILFLVAWKFICTLGAGILGAQLGPEIMRYVVIAANLMPVLMGIFFGLQRLLNLGMSRWWYLGNFVPLLNFWVGYRLFACPAGYAYHKKLDGAGVFLAILYWSILAISIVAMIAAIGLLFGMIGSPELQKQLQDAMNAAGAHSAKP